MLCAEEQSDNFFAQLLGSFFAEFEFSAKQDHD
jgi:hypothetical protein